MLIYDPIRVDCCSIFHKPLNIISKQVRTLCCERTTKNLPLYQRIHPHCLKGKTQSVYVYNVYSIYKTDDPAPIMKHESTSRWFIINTSATL